MLSREKLVKRDTTQSCPQLMHTESVWTCSALADMAESRLPLMVSRSAWTCSALAIENWCIKLSCTASLAYRSACRFARIFFTVQLFAHASTSVVLGPCSIGPASHICAYSQLLGMCSCQKSLRVHSSHSPFCEDPNSVMLRH